jgi:hypothetical protein
VTDGANERTPREAFAAESVARALVRFDRGDLVGVRRELEALARLLAAGADPLEAADESPDGAALATIGDSELESAFDEAEAQPGEMVDANSVAEVALRLVEEGTPEGVDLASQDSPFATETVAGLLESQGHAERAREVRSRVRERRSPREHALTPAQRAQTLATLSRWLTNLRRRTA